MEPTKAPWADGGRGRVFAAPEPGSMPGEPLVASPTPLNDLEPSLHACTPDIVQIVDLCQS